MNYDKIEENYDFKLTKGKSKSNCYFNLRNKKEKKKEKHKYNQKFIRNKIKNIKK